LTDREKPEIVLQILGLKNSYLIENRKMESN